MAAYELEYDEGIVLQSTSAYRRGPSEEDFEDEELMELVITNKRIIYVSEISKGIFSKTTTEVAKIPITDIKVINGVVQIKQIKHDIYGHCIQIQFVHGVEYWELEKKAIPQWIAEINRLLGVEPAPMQAAPVVKEKKAPAFGALSGFASALKNAAGTATQAVSSAVKQAAPAPTPAVETPVEEVPAVAAPQAPTNRFCSNCGSKLDGSAKFCSGCGSPVNGGTIPTPPPVPAAEPTPPPAPPAPPVVHQEERQQKYVGTISKCPNCGNVVNSTDAVCSCCGFYLSDKQVVSSVTDFQNRMMEIVQSRKKKKSVMFSHLADETDRQVLALIRTYPIPNTIEDIVEFMHLAIANINVSISKKTIWNSDEWSGKSIEKDLSNAWVAKMQQIYGKAELSFPNEPAFHWIQKTYFEKMKELGIKVK